MQFVGYFFAGPAVTQKSSDDRYPLTNKGAVAYTLFRRIEFVVNRGRRIVRFSVFAVGSFFTVLTVVPSLAIVSSVITVSLAVPIDRASRPSAVVDVPISSTVITLASIILAWGVFASAWWRW